MMKVTREIIIVILSFKAKAVKVVVLETIVVNEIEVTVLGAAGILGAAPIEKTVEIEKNFKNLIVFVSKTIVLQ